MGQSGPKCRVAEGIAVGTDDGLSETGPRASAVDEPAASSAAEDGVRSDGSSATQQARKGRRRRGGRRRRRSQPDGAVAGNALGASAAHQAVMPAPAAEFARQQAPNRIRDGDRTARCYAALDLGTNNCRLLVATPRGRGFRVVDSFSRIVRLGEGVGQTALLSDGAMHRAIAALNVCRRKLEQREVVAARLIATEACRLAANRGTFLERVKAETGLDLEVVSQETEARLASAGCASLIDPDAAGAILFDIGGGSSELVWIDLTSSASAGRRGVSEAIRSWQSLPVGVVNLSERHGGRDVDDQVYESMVDEVSRLLDGFPDAAALDHSVAGGGVHMLGTSGTVTTLAGVFLGLDRYDRRRVDGLWMGDEDVGSMIAELRQSDFAVRVANPCIGRDRADLVLAGCAVLDAIRRRWPCNRMRVADRGLREGILVELMSADGAWQRRRRRRRGGVKTGGETNGKG